MSKLLGYLLTIDEAKKKSKKKSDCQEQTEPLDELSSQKLGKYVKRAAHDVNAQQKLGMYNVAVSDTESESKDWYITKAKKHFGKVGKRLGGITKATEKLMSRAQETEDRRYWNDVAKARQNEETEPLDEIKKKDLAAYRKFWAHDPQKGEDILKFGKKERAKRKGFASGKREINRLKRQGK